MSVRQICDICGKLIPPRCLAIRKRDNEKYTYCSRQCEGVGKTARRKENREAFFKDASVEWKDGMWKDPMGYYLVCCPEQSNRKLGYIPLHRLRAQLAIGRKLKKDEIVHHIDGNIHNNKNDNLLICEKSYHRWLHNEMSRRYMQEHFRGEENVSSSLSSSKS